MLNQPGTGKAESTGERSRRYTESTWERSPLSNWVQAELIQGANKINLGALNLGTGRALNKINLGARLEVHRYQPGSAAEDAPLSTWDRKARQTKSTWDRKSSIKTSLFINLGQEEEKIHPALALFATEFQTGSVEPDEPTPSRPSHALTGQKEESP